MTARASGTFEVTLTPEPADDYERVSGTLRGRRGTFVLQHSGTMTRGAPSLSVTVVPDSGTDQLTGLSGTMTIDVAGGRHSYEFEYTIPPIA